MLVAALQIAITMFGSRHSYFDHYFHWLPQCALSYAWGAERPGKKSKQLKTL
jgi:hypothetical protein